MTTQPKKPDCPKCGNPYHYQMHRGWLFKLIAPIYPIKKYFCAKCMKARLVRKNGKTIG